LKRTQPILLDRHADYLQLSSLAAYLVFAQDEVKAWAYSRSGEKQFTPGPQVFAGADASISIPVLSIDLLLTDIYGGIDFDYRRQFSSYGGLAQRNPPSRCADFGELHGGSGIRFALPSHMFMQSSGELVRSRGLEPPRVAPLAPQASASTNSATTAGMDAGLLPRAGAITRM
jgi:hypothetical protein